MSTQSNHTPGRVQTNVAQNLNEFRNAVQEAFVPLRINSNRPHSFRAKIRTCEIGDIHFSELTATRHSAERTPDLISNVDTPNYRLSLQLSGTGVLLQDNRRAILRPGDLAIYDTNRPYLLTFENDFRVMVVKFPHFLLGIPSDLVGQITAVTMHGTSGIGSLISPFLSQLANNFDKLGGTAGIRLAHSAVDLITTMISIELEDLARITGPRTALFRQILEYIEDNLTSPDLGPSQLATSHFISTRHLHGLFREQGTTVSTWIRTRRLEKCLKELRDPICSHHSIATIATRWGFVDAAHFSRVFKAAFNASPSDIRAQAIGTV